MPKKVGHNCFQCSKLSNAEAQAKPCWDADRCPNRRHYQRNKERIGQQRREIRAWFNRGLQFRSDQGNL